MFYFKKKLSALVFITFVRRSVPRTAWNKCLLLLFVLLFHRIQELLSTNNAIVLFLVA